MPLTFNSSQAGKNRVNPGFLELSSLPPVRQGLGSLKCLYEKAVFLETALVLVSSAINYSVSWGKEFEQTDSKMPQGCRPGGRSCRMLDKPTSCSYNQRKSWNSTYLGSADTRTTDCHPSRFEVAPEEHSHHRRKEGFIWLSLFTDSIPVRNHLPNSKLWKIEFREFHVP